MPGNLTFVQNDHILHTRITSAVFENIIELSIVDVTTALKCKTTSFLEKNLTNVFQWNLIYVIKKM